MVRLRIAEHQRLVAFDGHLFHRVPAGRWQRRPFAFLWVLARRPGELSDPGEVADEIRGRFALELSLGLRDVARVRNVIVQAINACDVAEDKKRDFRAVVKTVRSEGTLLELKDHEVEIVHSLDAHTLRSSLSTGLKGVVDVADELRHSDARGETDLFLQVQQLPEELVGRVLREPWELRTESGARHVLEVYCPSQMAALELGGSLLPRCDVASFSDLATPKLEVGLSVIARNVCREQRDDLVRAFKRLIVACE